MYVNEAAGIIHNKLLEFEIVCINSSDGNITVIGSRQFLMKLFHC